MPALYHPSTKVHCFYSSMESQEEAEEALGVFPDNVLYPGTMIRLENTIEELVPTLVGSMNQVCPLVDSVHSFLHAVDYSIGA